MFERFYTSDHARMSQKTGLGLAITKTIVEKLNGRIYVWLEDERLTVKMDMKH